MLKTTEQQNVRTRRQGEAHYRALELVEELGEAHIERTLGISRTTIHRWKKREMTPSPAVMLAMESMAGRTFAMLRSKLWDGWLFAHDNKLHAPGYKYGFTGADFLAWWFERQMLAHYKRQNKVLKDKLARAYEELATVDAAANGREYTPGEPREAPIATHLSPAALRRQFWLHARRRQA